MSRCAGIDNGGASSVQNFVLFSQAPVIAAGSMSDPGGLNASTFDTWALSTRRERASHGERLRAQTTVQP